MESNFCCTSIQVLLRDASSLLPSSDATEPSRESQSNFSATAASAKYRCCCQLHCLTCGTHKFEDLGILATIIVITSVTWRAQRLDCMHCTLLSTARADTRSIVATPLRTVELFAHPMRQASVNSVLSAQMIAATILNAEFGAVKPNSPIRARLLTKSTECLGTVFAVPLCYNN